MGGKKTGPNPTDRAKCGVKRSLLTEGHGVPLGLVIDGANRHDMKLAKATLDALIDFGGREIAGRVSNALREPGPCFVVDGLDFVRTIERFTH